MLTTPAEHSTTPQNPLLRGTFHPRFFQRARKLTSLLTASVVLAGATGGCSAFQGPQPDRTLVGLEHNAVAIAGSEELSDAQAQVWRDQAATLHAEAERLCGMTKDGSLPPSCVYSIDPVSGQIDAQSQRTLKTLTPGDKDGDAASSEYTIDPESCAASSSGPRVAGKRAATLETVLDAMIASLSEADKTSQPLIADQYVAASLAAPQIPSLDLTAEGENDLVTHILNQLPTARGCDADFSANLSQADKQAVEEALGWQEASQYGLTTAAAYADPTIGNLMVAASKEHGLVEHALQTLVPQASTASAPGYATPTVTPTDPTSALQYAVLDGVQSTRMWRELAARAEDPAWREFCVRAAGQAALRSLPLVQAAGLSVEDAGLVETHS